MAELTLEDMARARELARAELERAELLLARVAEPFERAQKAVRQARDELQRIERGMGEAKRLYAIARAMDRQGVESVDPPMVVSEDRPVMGPDIFELVAVGAAGEALYRERGKLHAKAPRRYVIRAERIPEAVREVIFDESLKWRERGDRLRELGVTSGASYGGRSTGQVLNRVHAAPELVEWQERGKGDFGGGSGPMKPLAPPSGGRWRWLKVTAQDELEGGS
jgi:exonuclease VII small subunit